MAGIPLSILGDYELTTNKLFGRCTMSKIRTYHHEGEKTPQRIYDDHDWLREHENDLFERYGFCYVIVYEKQIVGIGKTEKEAVADAERKLPSTFEDVEVMPEFLGSRKQMAFRFARQSDLQKGSLSDSAEAAD